MGCPAKTVTQNGSGAALIAKPELAVEIIQAVKQGIDDWFSGKTKITDLNLNQKTLAIIDRNKKYSDVVETPCMASLPFRFRNHKAAGIWVFKNNLAGRLTMQSINPFSTNAFLISPSPEVLEVNAPLANTTPARPLGAK